eukprot:200874_1
MDKPASSKKDYVEVDLKEEIVELQSSQPEFVAATENERQRTIKNLDELPLNYERMDSSYDLDDNPKEGVGCIKGCRQSGNVKSWISLILTLGSILLFVYLYGTGNIYWFIAIVPMVSFFAVYTVEWAFCSASREYLDTALNKEFVYDDIERLNQCTPKVGWRIECYHYKHYKTGKSTKKRKVVTHTATMNYPFKTV